MKVNALMALAILALLWPAAALRAAVTKTTGRMRRRASLCLWKTTRRQLFRHPGGRWIRV
ncbi:hypothetical protein KPZU40_00330 [Klebsiella pneumoniae]|nr:hypothetical protein KPZU40_00330 [Klebsiella pneumoniae]